MLTPFTSTRNRASKTMGSSFLSRRMLFALMAWVAITLAAAGCSNPVDEEHEHEHEHEHALSEVHRLEIVSNNSSVVVIEDASFADGDPDTLFVQMGDAPLLHSLEATLEDGDELHLDELDDEYRLGYNTELLDAEIATFDDGGDARWSFHLEGVTAGATVLQLELLHLDHADYRTPEIPVVVRPSDNVAAVRSERALSGAWTP